MDELYEFKNSEYRLATMQLKAIAYDIVTGISRKKPELEENKALLKELITISDKVIKLTDALGDELQKLDQLEDPIKIKDTDRLKATSDIMNIKSVMTEFPIEERSHVQLNTEGEKEKNDQTKIKLDDISISKNQHIEHSKKKEEKTQSIAPPTETNLEKGQFVIPLSAFKNNIQKDINKTSDTPEEKDSQDETSNVALVPDISIKPTSIPTMKEEKISGIQQTTKQTNEYMSITKKILQKMTKNLSKAIMVKPNQLENLRKSRKYQEQLLANQGLFGSVAETNEETKINKISKQLPDEIERQIEDLTVKANVYYNEGETEKAQELYDKIRELNEQYGQTSDENK